MITKEEPQQIRVTINGNILEQVQQFKYLGSLLSEDGRSEREIRARIAMAKDAFDKHQQLLSNSLNKDIKKRLVKAPVWSVLLYGAETWTMKKADRKRLESC